MYGTQADVGLTEARKRLSSTSIKITYLCKDWEWAWRRDPGVFCLRECTQAVSSYGQVGHTADNSSQWPSTAPDNCDKLQQTCHMSIIVNYRQHHLNVYFSLTVMCYSFFVRLQQFMNVIYITLISRILDQKSQNCSLECATLYIWYDMIWLFSRISMSLKSLLYFSHC